MKIFDPTFGQIFGGSLGSGNNMSSLSSLLGGGSGGRSRQAAGITTNQPKIRDRTLTWPVLKTLKQ